MPPYVTKKLYFPQGVTVDFVRLILTVWDHVASLVNVDTKAVVTAKLAAVTGAQSDQNKHHFTRNEFIKILLIVNILLLDPICVFLFINKI